MKSQRAFVMFFTLAMFLPGLILLSLGMGGIFYFIFGLVISVLLLDIVRSVKKLLPIEAKVLVALVLLALVVVVLCGFGAYSLVNSGFKFGLLLDVTNYTSGVFEYPVVDLYAVMIGYLLTILTAFTYNALLARHKSVPRA